MPPSSSMFTLPKRATTPRLARASSQMGLNSWQVPHLPRARG